MIKVIHIRYFCAVATFGSLTLAAKSLGVSQPAVSYAIKEFEEKFGSPLFIRKNKRFELSPDGKKVFEILNPALEKLDNSIRRVESYAKSKSTIRAIVPEGVGAMDAVSFGETFKKERPDIKLVIKEMGCYEAKEEVLSGNADIAIQIYPTNFNTDELERIDCYHPKLMYVVSKNHKDAGRTSIALEEIGDSPLALYGENTFFDHYVMELFDKHGISPNVILSSRQFATLMEVVDHGIAGTITCPDPYLIKKSGICLIPIEEPSIQLASGIFYPKRTKPSESLSALIDFVAKKMAQGDVVTAR